MRKKQSILTVVITSAVLGITALAWAPAEQYSFVAPSLTHEEAVPDSLSGKSLFEQYTADLYQAADLGASNLDVNVFKKALVGYLNLKNESKVVNSILTIVDFNKSSREKRMWVIDMGNRKLVYNTLVAHGQGSGNDMANTFSNIHETHQSSLGFYVTGETYIGKHGLSLRLNGMDEGFNTNAFARAIVMHGASYVSEDFINQHGRLGRSYGCPAIPEALTRGIIEVVKGKSCIFINGNDSRYQSPLLNDQTAVAGVQQDLLSGRSI